jgi:hypothetical protein
MAQPTTIELFGNRATRDTVSEDEILTINLSDLRELGLDNAPADLGILAALIYKAYLWLSTNTDESVEAVSSLSISSPSIRNEEEKTSFNFSMEFFNAYDAPIFDPDI